MNFKIWLLNEIQHVSLPRMKINGILTDGIDFRFEDYRLGFNPKKNSSDIKPISGAPFFSGSFSAPLKNGNFLNVSFESDSDDIGTGSLAIALGQKVVTIDQTALHRELPNYWYDFAIFYLGNSIVKPPEYPRDDQEKGTMGTISW